MEKKKSKTFLAWLALGVGALIISTMAYFYSSHSFGPNTFRAAKYSVTTQELLDESAAQNLEIGQEIPAEISVTNNGEVPIMVRMQFLIDDEPVIVRDSANTPGWKFNMATGAEGNHLGYDGDTKIFYDIQIIPPKTIDENGEEKVTTCKYLKSITYLGSDNIKSEETSEYTSDKSVGNKSDPSTATWSETEPTTGKTGKKKTYKASKGMNLKVKIETLQATDAQGKSLELYDGAGPLTMMRYWEALGYSLDKITDATN